MIHPSYVELMQVVNNDSTVIGEEPVVNSRYSIVIAASKRARQIIGGDEPMIGGASGKKPLSVAVQELYEGKVKIVSEDEETNRDGQKEKFMEENLMEENLVEESLMEESRNEQNGPLEELNNRLNDGQTEELQELNEGLDDSRKEEQAEELIEEPAEEHYGTE